MRNNKAVFLDRDGCVNVEDNHIRDINQFRLYEDSMESIKRINAAGFKVVIITNQSGVARGLMTEDFVNEVHDLLLEWVKRAGARIDRIEYCPHHPEGIVEKYAFKCDCRKPAPGMVVRAAKALDIDLGRSYVVGDKISDIGLGAATGMKSILVRTGFGEREAATIERGEAQAPDHVAAGIRAATDWILENRQ